MRWARVHLRATCFFTLAASSFSRWCQVENVKADVHGNYTFAGPWRVDGCTTLSLDHGMCVDADCPRRIKFTDEEIIGLADELHGNTELSALSISSNAIKDQGAIALAEFIHGNQVLNEVNLQGNLISDEGALALAKAISSDCAVTVLNMQYNQLTDAGGEALMEVLKSNETSLDELFLEHNQISEELVAEAIVQNQRAFMAPPQVQDLARDEL
jgi:hypothetical protein